MTAHAPKTDKRLLGTWKSDGRRTVLEWRFAKRMPPSKRQKFFTIFGKLTVTYTSTRIRGVLNDYRFTQPYELLGRDSDTVVLRHHDTQLTGEWRIQHIHFQGSDCFWIALGRNREWFKRIKKLTAKKTARRRQLQ